MTDLHLRHMGYPPSRGGFRVGHIPPERVRSHCLFSNFFKQFWRGWGWSRMVGEVMGSHTMHVARLAMGLQAVQVFARKALLVTGGD